MKGAGRKRTIESGRGEEGGKRGFTTPKKFAAGLDISGEIKQKRGYEGHRLKNA